MIFFVSKPDLKYQFWLSVPVRPKRVVFWFHGSTTETPVDLAKHHPAEFEHATLMLPADCIVVTPLIPKLSEGARIIDPQCLCRNVMFDDLIDPSLALYNRPDREVLEIFAYLREFVFPPLGLDLDTFAVGGMSAGGNFASLFSVLHPARVTHVMSLLSCAHALPLDTLQYPFGRGGLERISDISPDLDRQRQIRYFVYHGELDGNDPIEYLANDDAHEASTVKSVLGADGVARARHAFTVLQQHGFTCDGHVIPGTAHQVHDYLVLREMLATFLG